MPLERRLKMFKVQSMIVKENNLENAIKDNNEACQRLLSLLDELTKKKASDIRSVLFNYG